MIDQETVVIDGDDYNIQSGDVICLEAGPKPYLLIRDIDKDDSFNQPVEIRNHEGQVVFDTDHYYGVSIWNCNNVVLNGKGDPDYNYGIKIARVSGGTGLSIEHLSSDVEVKGVEIANTLYAGLVSKTDPFCENGVIQATRSNYIQYNIRIHDNYIHHTGTEGMYIGSSKYLAGFDVDCGGETQHVLPHVNSGVKVYNNRVEFTGWDAIQVSSAVNDCDVYSNYIFHDSEEAAYSQMSGILIGGGSVCDCYNNKIIDGKGDGMDILGKGNQKIYNNLIVNAGQRLNDPQASKHGIYSDHIYTENGAFLYFYNNTIIEPKTHGISHRNQEISTSRAYNNAIIKPGDKYIHKEFESMAMEKRNNYFSQNVYGAGFDSPAGNDFDLNLNSPLINAGTSVNGLIFDIENRQRPFAGGMDIGAYECHKPGVGIGEQASKKRLKVFPSPFSNYVTVELELKHRSKAEIVIVNALGEKVFRELPGREKNLHSWNLMTAKWKSGVYFFNVKTGKRVYRGKILKQ